MASSSSSFLARALLAGAMLSISCSFIAYGAVEGLGDGVKRREFDYFKLAIQWPGTFCRRTRHCCSTNACCRGSNSPAEFTIHGLWPDYNDGTWPACCTRSQFDEKELSSLVDVLKKYWPSLSCGSTSTCFGGKGSFWAHEWEKHGTCSYPVFRDEHEYFLATINLYSKYNVTRVLFDAGYVPSNTEKYPLGGVITAIQNAFHLTPEVACSNGAVQEIYLCFYKDFTPRECAVGARSVLMKETSKSSCPKYVSLPEFVSKEAPPRGSSAPSHLNSSTKVYLLQTNADIHGGIGHVDVQ